MSDFELKKYEGERYSPEQWFWELRNKYGFDVEIQIRKYKEKDKTKSSQKLFLFKKDKYEQSALSELNPSDELKIYYDDGTSETLTKEQVFKQANDGLTTPNHWVVLDIDFKHEPVNLKQENPLFEILRRFDEDGLNYVVFGTEGGRGIKIVFSFKELLNNPDNEIKQEIGDYLKFLVEEVYQEDKPEIKGTSKASCSLCYPAKEGEEPLHPKTNKPIKILHFKGWENSLEDIKRKISEWEERFLLPFRDKKLLDLIKEEISREHLEDDNLKMSLFLTYVSGLLNNPKRRQSFQITGKTAEGKDNIQKACLRHMPKGSYLFLTNATQSVIEDDLKDIPILAISEINLFRDFGANKGLLEVIKQKIEGGTTSVKKDLRTNNKTLRFEEGEQGVVTFGTTDAEQDEELGTRLMKGTIRATPRRIKIVNDNTLNTFSDADKILEGMEDKDSWIRRGLTYFYQEKPKFEILIPYAKLLTGKIDGQEIFDNSDSRSQRDIKRLLSLTCATTWLFQEQRESVQIKGVDFLISIPEDLINTLKYSNEFFNQTYAGMDLRINDALKFIESKGKDFWVDKLEIQEHLNIKHRDTINKYLWELEQKGFIERSKGRDIVESNKCSISVQSLNTSFKGNHIYYKSVQKAFNKRLISVQLERLKEFLEEEVFKKSVQNKGNIEETLESQGKFEEKQVEETKKDILPEEIEHLKLNTSEEIDFNELDLGGSENE